MFCSIVLDYSTICIGLTLYAHELGASQFTLPKDCSDSLQKTQSGKRSHTEHPLGHILDPTTTGPGRSFGARLMHGMDLDSSPKTHGWNHCHRVPILLVMQSVAKTNVAFTLTT